MIADAILLRYLLIGLSLAAVVATLSGCADGEITKTVAVAIDVPKPIEVPKAPIPDTCDPAGRKEFPTVKKVPGDKTPGSALQHAFVTAKKRDADNADRELRCFCAEVETRGSADEKIAAASKCTSITPPPSPPQTQKPTS